MPTSGDRRGFLRTSVLAGGSLLMPGGAQAGIDSSVSSLSPVSQVKVADVRTYKLKDAMFVQVVSDAGTSGWGEASPANLQVVETIIHTALKRHIIGRSVWDAEPAWDEMFFANRDLGSSGGLTSAIAGIDIALWDLKGKLTGLPVYRLLGGKYRTRLRAVGSVEMSQTPDDTARQARKLVERGFTAIRLRVQIGEHAINSPPDPTFVYARAVRQAIGHQMELYLDLDNSYTAARAIEIGKRLVGELGVNYLEEPVSVDNLRELAQVARALDRPLIAGRNACTRWQFRDLIDTGEVGIIGLDVVKCGLTEAKKIAVLGQACSKPILPASTLPTVGTAATLQFMASISNAGPFVRLIAEDEDGDLPGIRQNGLEFKDGFLSVPQTPGLGLEVDEEVLKRSVGSRA